MGLRVYNTLTRKKQDFKPRDKGKVMMYVCGPTVYNYIHIGNARCYVAFDAIVRYLKFRGYQVYYARNITDIDDKIIKRSREENLPCENVAEKYSRAFNEDMVLLSTLPPDVSPKATEHLKEMIAMVSGLLEKGYAYETQGDVFFDVTRFPSYGKLSKRNLEEMRAGERIEPSPHKRYPLDFALWKKAKNQEPFWDSPWGNGRPGWHLECSVMSLKYLKIGFDIHGGGQDLIFPHHENEIAQSEAFKGEAPFVKFWLHNGFVNVNQAKMAKSLRNVILVREIFFDLENPVLSRIISNSLRVLFLGTHYRSPIDFSEQKLEEAIQAYNGFEDALNLSKEKLEKPPSLKKKTILEKKFEEETMKVPEKFIEAMDDDFNTAEGLAILFVLKNAVLEFLASPEFSPEGQKLLQKARENLTTLGEVLGLSLGNFSLELFLEGFPQKAVRSLGELFSSLKGEPIPLEDYLKDKARLKELVKEILAKRDELRKKNYWQVADEIRAKLKEVGLEIEDTSEGPFLRLSLLKLVALLKKGKENLRGRLT